MIRSLENLSHENTINGFDTSPLDRWGVSEFNPAFPPGKSPFLRRAIEDNSILRQGVKNRPPLFLTDDEQIHLKSYWVQKLLHRRSIAASLLNIRIFSYSNLP